MNDYKEYLNVTVIQENKPVTYKSLARSLKIHVNTAKQALYEFSTENQQTVHAVYCITGTCLKNDQFSIQLVKESEVEETKKNYKQITGVHVYSVTSFEPNDFSLLYSACKDIPKLTLQERLQCGILENVNVHFKKLPSSRSAQTNTPAAIVSDKPAIPKAAPAKPAAKPATTTTKRKGTLSFGPVTTKKQAIESTKTEPVKKSEPVKPVSKPVSKKSNQKKAKDDHEDIEMRMAKTTIRPGDIFTDDEDEEDQPEKPQPVEYLEIEDEDDIEMEEVTENKVSKKEDNDVNEDTSASESHAPVPPGKAKRKVLKKKTTKNARGLLVTEEIWEWETVDESEIEETKPKAAAPISKKAAPKKTTTNAKKSTAQTNLFSFFNKK